MINQKTNNSMNDCLRKTDERELDLKIESRLEWIELLKSEALAFRELQRLGIETKNYVPTLIKEEIQRRKAFLDELFDNF
jgi:hypothetical protein